MTLDSGGLLFSRPRLLPNQLKQGEITAQAIIEMYSLMRYDAVGINAYDLAAGVNFLKEIAREEEVPWLSANLLRSADQQPVFKPAITKSIGAIKLGIIGITDPAAYKGKDDFIIVPWRQTLPELVAEMNRSCDLLILLSSLPAQENHRIAEEIEGIHLILQNGDHNQPLEKVKNTLITGTGKKGKYLGELTINWQPAKKWGIGKSKQLQTARQKLDQINWRLKRLKRKGLPEKGAENNPRLLKNYHNLETTQQELKATILSLRNSKDEQICTYRNRFIALEKSLPEQPEVQAVVDRARAEVHRAGKKRSISARVPSLYLGWQRCAGCHPDQTQAWQKSHHANSYLTLANKKEQFNLDCLPCHVTGITDENSHQALALTKELQLVGCEECHGIGTEHVRTNGKRPVPQANPKPEVCLRCHTPDHSDDFNYQRDRQLVH